MAKAPRRGFLKVVLELNTTYARVRHKLYEVFSCPSRAQLKIKFFLRNPPPDSRGEALGLNPAMTVV